ncbi:MAG TPA: GNAT family N-acetyltransferase [Chloroflexia bacterium]|nr:GNAT family N-acetyltransferase [Chloroflexia bacterium]
MNKLLQGLRPYTASDIEGLAQLLGAADAWPPYPPTPQDLLNRWRHWDLKPEQDVSVLPGPDDGLIAFSQSAVSRRDPLRIGMEIAVHPRHQRLGIGSALYDLIESRSHELRATHLTSTVFMSPGTDKSATIHFLEKRGFKCNSAYWRLRIDQISQVGPPHWPEGIECRVFRNEHDDAVKWAHLVTAAFGEHATPEMILAQVSDPESGPNGYFYAVDSATGEEIGTSRARRDSIGGMPVGYIGTVGVLPEYRGRGIAEALMRQTLLFIASQGMDSATLFVEDSNKPARALYEKMGWYPVHRTDHYWKTLLPTRHHEPPG